MRLSKSSIFTIIAALSITGQVKADCESDSAALLENQDLVEATLAFVAQCGAELLQGESCDSSAFKEACESAGGDYITYTGNLMCDDYYSSLQDFPDCVAPSCTEDGERAFERMIEDSFEFPEGETNCKLDFDVDEISGGFSRNIMTGSLALLSLAGVGASLL